MKLRPQDFWSLGLDEWRWLCAGERGEAMRLDDLKALVRLYPDETLPPSVRCADTSPAGGGGNGTRALGLSSPACGGSVAEGDEGGTVNKGKS